MQSTTRDTVGSSAQDITVQMFEPTQFDSLPKNQVTDLTSSGRKFQDFVNSIYGSLPDGPGRQQVLYHLKQAQLWHQDSIIQSGRNVGVTGKH